MFFAGKELLFTAAFVKRSDQVGHGIDVAGQLHLEQLVQPPEAILGEAQVKVGEFGRRADPHESCADESKSIEIGCLSIHNGLAINAAMPESVPIADTI